MTRRPRAVPTSLLPSLLLGLAVALAGCGGDDGRSSDGSDDPTDQPTSSESTSAEATDEPSVASGESITVTGLSLRVPDSFELTPGAKQDEALDGPVVAVGSTEEQDLATITVTSDIGAVSDTSLDFAQQTLNDSESYTRVRTLDPVEVDGVEMFHEKAQSSSRFRVEAFGAATGGRLLFIEFEYPTRLPAAPQRETVDAVLASVDVTA